MPDPNPMKGISRIDQPEKHNHGFFVRLTRRGAVHSAFFSDKSCGGQDKALAAAQQCYQKLLAQFGPPAKRNKYAGPLVLSLGSRLKYSVQPQNPPANDVVWVQCSDRRCLAFLDEQGFWVSLYTRRQITDFVRIID